MSAERIQKRCRAASDETLVKIIDDIQDTEADQLILLPQIVLYGHFFWQGQEILEAITGFPSLTFLGASEYPLEIKMRHSSSTRFEIRIKPCLRRHNDTRNKMKRFYRHIMTPNDVEASITKAGNTIQTLGNISTEKIKFDDMICVRISSPGELPLTLTSFPHQPSSSHMSNESCFMLTLSSSGLPKPYCEDTLETAKSHDPDGRRSMGIWVEANPNLASRDEIQTFRGSLSRFKYSHGWYLLAAKEDPALSIEESSIRYTEMFKFLRITNQSFLDMGSTTTSGIVPLMSRLHEIYLEQIRSYLQIGIFRMGTMIMEYQHQIQRPNKPWDAHQSSEELENTLSKVNRMLLEGSNGTYSSTPAFFFGGDEANPFTPSRKLWTAIQEKTKIFAASMRNFGHEREFPWDAVHPGVYEQAAGVVRRALDFPQPFPISGDGWRGQVEQQIQQLNLGRDLDRDYGNARLKLIHSLFIGQSVRWKTITRHHLNDVVEIVQRFCIEVFRFHTGQDASQILTMGLIEPFIASRRHDLLKSLEELLLAHQKVEGMRLLPNIMVGHLYRLHDLEPFVSNGSREQKYDDILNGLKTYHEVRYYKILGRHCYSDAAYM
jgi:hypothetical protein